MTDRNVYQCPHTGLFYDPLAAHRLLLLRSRNQVNEWLRARRGDDELAAMEADEKLLPVVREAFSLSTVDPVSGTGITDGECFFVLDAFLVYLEGKESRGLPGPPSSRCPGCPPG